MTTYDSEIDPDARPLVMVVEDNVDTRKLRAEGLTQAGCAVIPVDSVKAALMTLRVGPAVDFILTDMNLGDAKGAHGGLVLAEQVHKNYAADLPIAMYSGQFGIADFSHDQIDLLDRHFVKRHLKGNATIRMQKRFYADCRDLAVRRSERRALALKTIAVVRQEGHATKSFALKEEDDVDALLAALGFELRLLTTTDFSSLLNPIPVWLRSVNGQTEVHVSGHPEFHWTATTEKAALGGLVTMMSTLARDFAGITDVSPYAKHMKDFLAFSLAAGEDA